MSGPVGFLLVSLFATGVMGLIAWAIADELPQGDWFNEAVGRGVAKGIAEAFAAGGPAQAVIAREMDLLMRKRAMENKRISGNLTPVSFTWQMAFHMMRTDPTMKAATARDFASRTLREFLRDEGIEFGAAHWSWDQDAAETLAREYETDHWEFLS